MPGFKDEGDGSPGSVAHGDNMNSAHCSGRLKRLFP